MKRILRVLAFIGTASVGGFALILVAAYFLPDSEDDKVIPMSKPLIYKKEPNIIQYEASVESFYITHRML